MKLKNVLFLMFAMLVLTLSSFGQSDSKLKTKYAAYLDKSNAYLKANNSTDKPLSYNKWLVTIGKDTTLTNRQKTLHREYDSYFDYTGSNAGSNKVPLSYNDWLKKENLVDISGVNYVKQPKSNIKTDDSKSNIKTDDSMFHRKYKNYYDNLTYYKKTPMSYQDWLKNNGYVDNSTIPSSSELLKSLTISNLSSGDYLIKAKKQMIGGFICQIISAGVIIGSTATTPVMNTNETLSAYTHRVNSWTSTRNGINIGAGVLSLIGLGFEISGICNIGKAGLSLNENGIGVKVKF